MYLAGIAAVSIVIGAAIAVQAPGVQTRLAKKAISIIADKIDGRIEVGRIHANPFKALVLRDVAIIDNYPYIDTSGHQACDTLFRAKYITATFGLRNLIGSSGFSLSTATVRDAMMYLSIEPGTDSSSANNLKRIFRLKKRTEEKERSDKDVFSISKVRIENMSFIMDNFRKDPSRFADGINWFDMDVSGINVSGRQLKMKGAVMSGICDSLSFKEKSGYSCKRISGRASVGNGVTDIQDLRITDPWSDIRMPRLTMAYENTGSWSEFVSEVRMDGNIERSQISLETLGYFAPSLKGKTMEAEIEGHVEGFVNDMNLDDIDIKASGLSGNLSGSVKGLPDTGKMRISASVRRLGFTSEGLEHFIKGWAPSTNLQLGRFCKGEWLNFSGRLNGRLDNFSVIGSLGGQVGKVGTNLRIKNMVNKCRPMDIGGEISAENLDVRKVLGSGPVGECSLRAGATATVGRDTTGISIDSLFVDRLNLNDYDYSGIAAAGQFSGNTFDGRIVCSDPNLNFLFQGIFTFSTRTRNAIYQFYANLGYADLHALNIDKRGTSRMSLRTQANFRRISGEDIIGNIDIQNIVLEDEHGKHNVGDIGIASVSNNDINRVKFSSSFADASYAGSRFLASFIRDVQAATSMKALPSLYTGEQCAWEDNHYDLRVDFHDSRDILSFFAPGTYIADSTSLKLKVSRDGDFNARLKSGRIAYKDKYIKNIDLSLKNPGESLEAELSAGEVYASPVMMNNAGLSIDAKNDSLGVRYSYDNSAGKPDGNKGTLSLAGRISRENGGPLGIEAGILPSSIMFNSRKWDISSNDMFYRDASAKIGRLDLKSPGQSIRVEGGWAASRSDTLNLVLDRFDLGIINSLTSKDMGIGGKVTGRALLVSPTEESAGILLNLLSDSTAFAGRDIGTLRLASVWEEEAGKFNIVCRNILEGRQTINLAGNYYPKTKGIEGEVALSGTDLGYAAPFLNSIFSSVGGEVSGRVGFSGTVTSPEVESTDLKLDKARLKVAFTGVEYTASGPVQLNSSGVRFDNVAISDRYNAAGTVTGSIGWNHFKDMNFDTRLNFRDMLVLDTAEGDNPTFYGNLYASGDMAITGPLNSLMLSATAKTAKTGSLHIPIGGSESASVSNLLTFKEIEKIQIIDPYEELMKKLKTKEKKPNDLGVRLKVTATPEVEADIEIDKASGNVLSGRGNGLLDLDIRPSRGVFNINGNYNITQGNYHFVALGIAKRDFSIQDGSSIRFNGDIMDSDLDIDAIYKTKASVGTLIADTTSTSTRRLVECQISISDKIRNPRLGFSINIPDLDPTTQARVESALNTQDKVQKQLLALLITNSFIPDEQSGVTNRTSSTLYSNVTEIMAGQLNNILQKLDIPVDFGFDYQQNMSGTDIFDVALSTALFNNRVIVNGTLGNRQFDTGSSGSEFVGDLDIDVKLTKSGALRLNLFSHSADQYTNYLDNSQRNGLGLTYQKEYDRTGDFFRNLFKGRKKRQEAEAARQQELMNQERVKIIIGPAEPQNNKKKKNARKP
ncbi:MAG: translocation/assembly module TamB domain-containing protein [Candidatus Cryptobacteroides sp.]